MYSLIICLATEGIIVDFTQQAISLLILPNLASSSKKTTTGKLNNASEKLIAVDSSFSGSFF